eukprot:COSAG04_NODE_104_length_26097_cov_12.466074_7_plen_183_part_00
MGVTRRHFSLVSSFLQQRGGGGGCHVGKGQESDATLGKGKNQMLRKGSAKPAVSSSPSMGSCTRERRKAAPDAGALSWSNVQRNAAEMAEAATLAAASPRRKSPAKKQQPLKIEKLIRKRHNPHNPKRVEVRARAPPTLPPAPCPAARPSPRLTRAPAPGRSTSSAGTDTAAAATAGSLSGM